MNKIIAEVSVIRPEAAESLVSYLGADDDERRLLGLFMNFLKGPLEAARGKTINVKITMIHDEKSKHD